MARQITESAQVAKIIRNHLKTHKVDARVTKSGHNCVNVTLKNPLPATLEAVQKYAQQFEMGAFNGMTDCYEYDNRNDDIPQVRFIFVNTEYSDEIVSEARQYVEKNIKCYTAYEADMYTNMVISGVYGDLWASRKPRIKASA